MIDSVVWAQYINVTDRQTDSHVAMANAAPTHWSRTAKTDQFYEEFTRQHDVGLYANSSLK